MAPSGLRPLVGLAGLGLLAMFTSTMAGAIAPPGVAGGQLGTVDTVAGPGFCPGPATVDREASGVRSLSVDTGGQLHVDTGPSGEGLIAKVDAEGRTSLVRTGVSDEPGPASPSAGGRDVSSGGRLVADGAGGVLINARTRILSMDARGGLTTVAGKVERAAPGSTGDGGPASEARFTRIEGLAGDGQGNLYVAEATGAENTAVRVRLINRGVQPVTAYPGTPQQLVVQPGSVDTIAGGPDAARTDDGTPARLAGLPGTRPAMAVRGTRLYLAAQGGGGSLDRQRASTTVRLVNLGGEPVVAHGLSVAAGTVAMVVGGGGGGANDGQPARTLGLSSVPGIAADDQGNLLVADEAGHRILRVDPAGLVSSFAGTGARGGGFNGNDRPATEALLNRPFDVKIGPEGRGYISDGLNGQVRIVDRAGTIRAAPGNGLGLSWTCVGGGSPAGGTAIQERPQLGGPVGVAADRSDNVFLTTSSRQVKRLDPSGFVITTAGSTGSAPTCLPGASCAPSGGDGTPAADARFQRLSALATGSGGLLYVFDGGGNRVHVVNLGSRSVRAHGVSVPPSSVRAVAGSGSLGSGGDGGRAVAAQLSDQGAVAVDGRGNLYIADLGSRRVRRVDAEGTITTVMGGDPASPQECCGVTTGVAADDSGGLYVSGISPTRVWFRNLGPQARTVHGQTVPPGSTQPVVGTGGRSIGGDGGPALAAQLQRPAALALDRQGNLYIADLEDNSVRKVDPAGTITTVVGTGAFGFNGDGLKASLTTLSSPSGLAFDPCGNLLIADSGNDRVRRLNLVGPCESPSTSDPSPRRPSLLLMVLASAALLAVGGGAAAVVYRNLRR